MHSPLTFIGLHYRPCLTGNALPSLKFAPFTAVAATRLAMEVQ